LMLVAEAPLSASRYLVLGARLLINLQLSRND
jgi:hypothetical protein